METLPLELGLQIFDYLNDRDLYNCLHSSKKFRTYLQVYRDKILDYRFRIQARVLNYLLLFYKKHDRSNGRATHQLCISSYTYSVVKHEGIFNVDDAKLVNFLRRIGCDITPIDVCELMQALIPYMKRFDEILDETFYDGPFYQILTYDYYGSYIYNNCSYDRKVLTYRDILDGILFMNRAEFSNCQLDLVIDKITFEEEIPRFHYVCKHIKYSSRLLTTTPPVIRY